MRGKMWERNTSRPGSERMAVQKGAERGGNVVKSVVRKLNLLRGVMGNNFKK